jgi:hypothetical protein
MACCSRSYSPPEAPVFASTISALVGVNVYQLGEVEDGDD